MLIKKCTVCENGEFNYSMSDITLIPNTTPPEVETEGLCYKCGSYIHIRFKAYEVDVIKYDGLWSMEEKGRKKFIFHGIRNELKEKT